MAGVAMPVTAHSGRRSGERRPPFAALNRVCCLRGGEPRARRSGLCRFRARRGIGAVRAANEAAQSAAGVSGFPQRERSGPKARGSGRLQRRRRNSSAGVAVAAGRCRSVRAVDEAAHGGQDGGSRHAGNRSLWPSFWRTTAPVRGSDHWPPFAALNREAFGDVNHAHRVRGSEPMTGRSGLGRCRVWSGSGADLR